MNQLDKKVEETIMVLCDLIQDDLEKLNTWSGETAVAEIVKATAELIKASRMPKGE